MIDRRNSLAVRCACLLFAGLMLAFICKPMKVRAENIPLLTEDQLAKIRAGIVEGYEKGEVSVDLSELGITVEMRSDRFSPEYRQVLDLAAELEKEYLQIPVGSRFSQYAGYIGFETEEIGKTDQWGCGPCMLSSARINIDPAFSSGEGERFDPEKIKSDGELMQREYDCALSCVTEDMTEPEKALVLHDYLVALCDYPDGTDADGTRIYDASCYQSVGLLRDHTPVCAAYATVYAWLLNDCGIPAVTLTSAEMDHSWTMLKLGEEWYHADVTWDDRRYESDTDHGDYNGDHWDIGAVSHGYFLKTDEEISFDHYNWSLDEDWSDQGLKKAPTTPKENAYGGYIFGAEKAGNLNTHFCKLGRYWYFTGPEGEICRTEELSSENGEPLVLSDEDGTEIKTVKSIYTDGDLLLFNTGGRVYGYAPERDILFVVFNGEERFGAGSVVSETAYTSKRLRLEVIIPEAPDDPERWVSVSETLSEEQLQQICRKALSQNAEEDPKDNSGQADENSDVRRMPMAVGAGAFILIGGLFVAVKIRRRRHP